MEKNPEGILEQTQSLMTKDVPSCDILCPCLWMPIAGGKHMEGNSVPPRFLVDVGRRGEDLGRGEAGNQFSSWQDHCSFEAPSTRIRPDSLSKLQQKKKEAAYMHSNETHPGSPRGRGA